MPDAIDHSQLLVQIRERIDILLAQLQKDREELTRRADLNVRIVRSGQQTLDAAIGAVNRTAMITHRAIERKKEL